MRLTVGDFARHPGGARRALLVGVAAWSIFLLGPQAFAQTTGVNVQEGDNTQSGSQDGSSSSGDVVGGQVVGIVSSGSASVDATNESVDVDVESGDVEATNEVRSVVGNIVEAGACAATQDTQDTLCPGQGGVVGALFDEGPIVAEIVHEGDNEQSLDQAITASSGDAVAGQVAGVVSSGSADLVLDNASVDVDATSGDVDADNDAEAQTLNLVAVVGCCPLPAGADINATIIDAVIVHEGDNTQAIDQSADASSGDAVAGQVTGVVTTADGIATVDATNRSEDVDARSGDVEATNDVVFGGVGNVVVGGGTCCPLPTAADILADRIDAVIVHEGDNTQAIDQSADATSGDAVAGQVTGVVADGAAQAVLDNTSEDIDVTTGDAEMANEVLSVTAIIGPAPVQCCPLPVAELATGTILEFVRG